MDERNNHFNFDFTPIEQAIKKAREARGMTREELSGIIGYDQHLGRRCGASYVARYKTRKDGSRYKAWRCYEAANHGRPHIDKAGNQVGCSGESIRNEDAIYLLYLVCRELKINRQKVVDNLTKTIDAVMRIDLTGTSTSALSEKIEEAKKKRTGLIDLYTSGDIDKTEFTALRAKYDEDIEKLKSTMEGIEQQQAMILKQRELMADIKNAIDELINGIQYEDEYYTQILDKMVINDKNHIDVYLKMLPHKWSFTVAKGVTGALETLAGKRPLEAPPAH